MLAKGCLLSKRCDIGPDGFPSRTPKCCQMGGFPLRLLHYVTASETGLPLSTHFNPQQTVPCTQSRSFPQQPTSVSSLFCSNGFKASHGVSAKTSTAHRSLFAAPTQGRLHCTQLSPVCRFSHPMGEPPRRHGWARMPLRIPHTSLTPSIDP